MAASNVRVLLVGSFGLGALERSYEAAFRQLGCEVVCFDIAASEQRYCRLGFAGRTLNRFLPVEAWIRKANREMVVRAQDIKPKLIVTFGQNRVRVGPLAQVLTTSDAAAVHIWPDTMVNVNEAVTSCLPLYDMVATYGRNTVREFQRLGARRVQWVPLAGDPTLHHPIESSDTNREGFSADIGFVGQWRPEREQALMRILSELNGIKLKIWGPDWGRRCRGNRAILRAWQRKSLYGDDFSKAVSSCKVNLNIIDPTNYPSANMRFFEIPCAGGLQVSSPCPEMEDEFRHGDTIFYYRTMNELPRIVTSLLESDVQRHRIADAARQKLLGSHTYAHRAAQILHELNLKPAC